MISPKRDSVKANNKTVKHVYIALPNSEKKGHSKVTAPTQQSLKKLDLKSKRGQMQGSLMHQIINDIKYQKHTKSHTFSINSTLSMRSGTLMKMTDTPLKMAMFNHLMDANSAY